MKSLKFLIIILLLFQSCRRSEGKKTNYHNLKEPLSSFFPTEDTLFKTFYNKEFLQTLDTMKFEGNDLPVKSSLMEYYGGSFYTVTHVKLLFSSYPKMGRIYFFKYEGKRWSLKWFRETSSKTVDSIRFAVRSLIDEDKRQLAKNSSDYRAGDLARYTVKNGLSDTSSIERITLDKPGDILLNTLTDLKHE